MVARLPSIFWDLSASTRTVYTSWKEIGLWLLLYLYIHKSACWAHNPPGNENQQFVTFFRDSGVCGQREGHHHIYPFPSNFNNWELRACEPASISSLFSPCFYLYFFRTEFVIVGLMFCVCRCTRPAVIIISSQCCTQPSVCCCIDARD